MIGRYHGDKIKNCKSKDQRVEIYTSGRFFVVTGNQRGDYTDIADITATLPPIASKYLEQNSKDSTSISTSQTVVSDTGLADQELLKLALAKPSFQKIWNGQSENPDDSANDYALMCKLIELGGGEEQCIRLIQSSTYAMLRSDREKLFRHDYLSRTYNNALKDVKEKKKEKKSSDKKRNPPLQIKDMAAWMNQRMYSVRFNQITFDIEVSARSDSGRNMNIADLTTCLYSDLVRYYANVQTSVIKQYLEYIAHEQQYNPVLDYLDELTWDGNDHIEELYALMGIPEDAALERLLIRRWLYQSIALLYNTEEEPFGAEGVLVIQGDQGSGKSSLCRRLALQSKWFGDGIRLNKYDKDTTHRAVTKWITELGELESTFKEALNKEPTQIEIEGNKWEKGKNQQTRAQKTLNTGGYTLKWA